MSYSKMRVGFKIYLMSLCMMKSYEAEQVDTLHVDLIYPDKVQIELIQKV